MLIDVNSPGVAEPVAALLLGQVEDAFRRLRRLAGDMTQAELDYRGPDGTLNSTATLLSHMAYVDLAYLYMMQDQPIPADLEADYGPYQDANGKLPQITGRTLAELLARYERVQEMVRTHVLTLKDADMDKTHLLWNGKDHFTNRWVLWHIADHSMFHQGHIRWLRAWSRAADGRGT